MNTAVRTAAAALLMTAAVSGLAACGETVDVVPAATVREELKPQEHQGHKGLADAREQNSSPVKPFEHQLRRSG